MTDEIAHQWEPIQDLPDDWASFASTELRALSDVWSEQKGQLAGSDALTRFNARLAREWAIETGVIERVYALDRGITALLIERGIDASLIPHEATDKDPELVTRIIRDQEAAVGLLFDLVRGGRALSISFIKELHALMTRHQATALGQDQFGREVEIPLLRGEWKRLPNNPTRPDGSVHEYCAPEQAAPEMERLVDLHTRHEAAGVAPEVEAAWLHHRFTQVHPFQDGNGRIARALASLVFIRAGWFPLVVTRDDRGRYIDALEHGDAGDLHPLVALFAGLERKAFVDALGVAREVLAEGERVQQVLASLGEMFAKRDQDRRQEWDRAKVLGRKVLEHGRHQLEAIAERLVQEIGGFSPAFRFFVDTERNDGKRRDWYLFQTIEVARRLGYFANSRDYRGWARLHLGTESQADIVLSLTAVGREYRGLIGASVCFFRREEEDEDRRRVVDIAPASEELFQLNYKDEEGPMLERFDHWLDRSLVCALEMWRQGI